MRRHRASGLGLCITFSLLACTPGLDHDRASAAGERPPPFDQSPVMIALVQYSGAGDYFQQWTDGARQQADAVGFTIQHHDARADVYDVKVAECAPKAVETEQNDVSLATLVLDHISNADIELMTRNDSPWKATATTDPGAVGAAVTRTLALRLAGQLGSRQVVFPGVLVTGRS